MRLPLDLTRPHRRYMARHTQCRFPPWRWPGRATVPAMSKTACSPATRSGCAAKIESRRMTPITDALAEQGLHERKIRALFPDALA